MDADDFIEMVQQPEFGDTMNFALHRDKPDDKTFSEASFDEIISQMRVFVGGRVIAEWAKTGVAPHHLTVTVTCDFTPDKAQNVHDLTPPWFKQPDGPGLDGAHRGRR